MIRPLVGRELGFGASELGLGALKLGVRFSALGHKLRSFQPRNQFTLPDLRAAVHADPFHEACNFGQNVHLLVRHNLGREPHLSLELLRDDSGHFDRGRGRFARRNIRGLGGLAFSAMA